MKLKTKLDVNITAEKGFSNFSLKNKFGQFLPKWTSADRVDLGKRMVTFPKSFQSASSLSHFSLPGSWRRHTMPRQRRRSSKKQKKILPCTYNLGNVRQDLYSCRRCTADAKGVHSAFCAGCRQACHADHPEEVFELYTKRAFRCDCGNTRAGNCCKLQRDKDDLNVENEKTYSHNFEGLYCICNTEYDKRLAMAQCSMCEDWFHEQCYKTDSEERGNCEQPFTMEYEFVCRGCVAKLPILSDYYEVFHAWTGNTELRRWKNATDNDACVRPAKRDRSPSAGALDLLLRPGFRVYLCRCSDCMNMYRATNSMYIVDRADFVNPVEEDIWGVFEDAAPPLEDDISADDESEEIQPVVPPPRNRLRRTLFDDVQIPRLSIVEALGANDISSRLSKDSVESITTRIRDFLIDHAAKHRGGIDREEILIFLSELKAEVLSPHLQRLDDAFGESWSAQSPHHVSLNIASCCNCTLTGLLFSSPCASTSTLSCRQV